jgi:2'-5' RNA ligase
VGIGGEADKLNQLHQHLEANLTHLGFTPETRAFTPHLTLARLRNQSSPGERQRFGQLVTTTRFETAYTIRVDTVSLMKSQLSREGAIYSRLSSAGLNKNGSSE